MFDLDRWEEIWQTINRNRKRSTMTAFGVFWGIFMLTVMMGSGLGLRNLLYANLNGMNENSCFLWGGKTSIPYKGLPAGRYWQLDNDDMRIIETQIPGIKAVGGIFWGSSYNFSRNDRKGTYSIVGYTPSFQQILPQRLLFGRANLAGAVPGRRKSGRPHDPDEQHLFDGRRRDGRIERGHKFPLGCLRVAPARHSATDVQHGQAPAPGLGGGL